QVADCKGDTPFDLAVGVGNADVVDVLHGSVTFDEFVSAHDKCRLSYEARLKPLIEMQCEGLAGVLIPDVMVVMFDYLGFSTQQAVAL
ncbi:MAG TPA: hypothetical protein PLS50_05715, partial [Candidatus Dojkabacteria bacterium]|nr:hypothetical protein [Candidatus Dojkabacteria bacterium]